MMDREKAIRILEGNYKSFVFRHKGELLTVNELIALLKAQEPRVMTLEEARKDIEVWYESVNGACGWGDLCYDANLELALYTLHGIKGVKEEAYGKTWRCWTSRPTDEQREATPWQE